MKSNSQEEQLGTKVWIRNIMNCIVFEDLWIGYSINGFWISGKEQRIANILVAESD